MSKPMQNIYLLTAFFFAASAVIAGDIPYGIRDKGQLDNALKNAEVQLAKDKNDIGATAAAGIAEHQLAILRVKGAAEKAVEHLKQATSLDPKNTELLAYLGSAYAMAGRDSSFVVTKVSSVNKGLAALDKAVKLDPSNLDVRFIRASVQYSLPGMFARKQQASDDYLYFADHVSVGQDKDRVAEAYFKIAKIAVENEDPNRAKLFFEKSKIIAPGSEWSQQAEKAQK